MQHFKDRYGLKTNSSEGSHSPLNLFGTQRWYEKMSFPPRPHFTEEQAARSLDLFSIGRHINESQRRNREAEGSKMGNPFTPFRSLSVLPMSSSDNRRDGIENTNFFRKCGSPRGAVFAKKSSGNPSKSKTPQRNNKENACAFCGYDHTSNREGTGLDGSGDGPSKKTEADKCESGKKRKSSNKNTTSGGSGGQDGSGDADGKKGDGGSGSSSGEGGDDCDCGDSGGDEDKGSGSGGGSGKGKGRKSEGDGDGDGDKRKGPFLNADDPNICPDWLTDSLCYVVTILSIVCFLGLLLCSGSESIGDCLGSVSFFSFGSCKLNDNLLKFFNKSSTPGSCGCDEKKEASGGGGGGRLPDHMQEQFKMFKQAVGNKDCLLRYTSKCPGLVNYAGTLAGASIISTRDTKQFPNPMLCRCHDPGDNRHGKPCDPTGSVGGCSDCRCEKIEADTLIKEEERLIAGRCFAFSGTGQILVGLFYPIVVTGVTIHHPPKEQLLPGFFSSAPKNFEVWGYNSTTDENPYLLGSFEYASDGFPSQLFEVQNFTVSKYSLIQFNFLTNHGNKNYTAVYKLEVHGLLDNSDLE